MPKQSKDPTPKDIVVVDEQGTFKLYKKWTNKKTSTTPFMVTDDLTELVNEYREGCIRWNIPIDMSKMFTLVNKYQQ